MVRDNNTVTRGVRVEGVGETGDMRLNTEDWRRETGEGGEGKGGRRERREKGER